MEENVNVPELVRDLGSQDDSTRKMAAFKLQSAIGDPSFADVFIYQGGLPKLHYLTLHATGNTLAYSLASFSNLLGLDQGWEWINADLVARLAQLVVGHPLINILRGAMSILASVVSHPQEQTEEDDENTQIFGFKALKPALNEHPEFLEMLVGRLSSADHALCVAALQLINALMREAMSSEDENSWARFVQQLQALGAIAAVHGLMQITALQDLAQPLLEFQTLIKISFRKWKEIPVDLDQQDHRRALRAVHASANAEILERNDNVPNGDDSSKRDVDKWRKLGFDTESPASEFEQVGCLGLNDLEQFATKDEDGFQKLILEQMTKESEDRCPVAKASIAVSTIFCDHFEIEEAKLDDQQQYAALESHTTFGRLFKPLLLQWSRVHSACVNAFIRLWAASGAKSEDFNKIESLVRVLVEQVIGFAPRSKEVSSVEEEMASHWHLGRLRELQMELMELTHEEAWGRHLRQVKEELHHESLQFMKEQRVRCLLQGSWFPNNTKSIVEQDTADETDVDLPWRFAKLSHNRRVLHYDDFTSKTKAGEEPSLDSLDRKLDLTTVTSVVSRPSSASSGSTLRSPSRSGSKPRVDTSYERSARTSIVIYGRTPANSSPRGNKGSKHQRTESTSTKEEIPLLSLHPSSQRLASEWLDGLLMLLGQTPITGETNKLVDFIAKYGLRIRLLNVRFEEVMGTLEGSESYGKKVEMPSREGIDDEFYYEMPGG